MPSIIGSASEEEIEALIEYMVENDRFESKSEAVGYCIRFTLANRYDEDLS